MSDTHNEDVRKDRVLNNEQIAIAYKHVFMSEMGKLVLSDMMRWAQFDENGVEKPAFLPGTTQRVEHLAHLDGCRESVRRVVRFLNEKVKANE